MATRTTALPLPLARGPAPAPPPAGEVGAGAEAGAQATAGGNYFVANYPPFSCWSAERIPEAERALARPPAEGTPLGLYVHVPFCRKRCHFCYFKVYTDRNAAQIAAYTDDVVRELELYAGLPFVGGRKPRFVYFGGGTPSYLSTAQLERLAEGLQKLLPWDAAEEITFECEPGTLSEAKLRFLRAMGVTRLSLGIEHVDEEILRLNNRAHGAAEIDLAYRLAREVGFPQINIDLIAGMLGETDAGWARAIDRTLELAPDSVTIYQMEIPFNTTIYREMREGGQAIAPVADWPTKRRWVGEAFARLEAAGYRIGSAYTAVRESAEAATGGDPARAAGRAAGGAASRFLYRDALWTGADLLGIGVSSFSHVGGAHFQNHRHLETWAASLARGERPIARALAMTPDERLVRELILQLKLGRVPASRFRERFGVDIRDRFAAPLARHAEQGWLAVEGDEVVLTREGLLRVDHLLPSFFLPEHTEVAYA